MHPDSHMQLPLINNSNCLSVSSFVFVSLKISLFSSIFRTIAVFFFMESTPYVFYFRGNGVFLPCDHGLDFDISVCC